MTKPNQPTTPTSGTISQLIETAGSVLQQQLGELEITGTISGFKRARHLSYARLIAHDPTTNQPAARLPVVFRPNTVAPGQTLEGALVAITGHLTSHLLYGPIQFTAARVVVLDEKSEATLATLALRRAILNEGLDRTNKQHRLPYDAQRIGLICPIGGGAAGADVRNRLDNGPHDWDLHVVETSMGGANPEATIASAITRSGQRDLDALLVCRGGGAASDMAAFNSTSIAQAIVQSPVPVIVAVGHATDSHVADLVAHTSLPTPTAAADWLNTRRDSAATQARDLVTKAAQAAAMTEQATAAAAKHQADRAKVNATTRERHARYLFAAALLFVVVAVALSVLT